MGKIFVVLQYSKSQLNKRTSGRLDLQTFYHPPTFLLLAMDEYTVSFQVQVKTINNLKS
jgi:hypothetical protein